MQMSRSISVLAIFVSAISACSSASVPSAPTAQQDAGGNPPPSGGTASACMDFGGTCGAESSASSKCAAGLVPVIEGDGCAGALDVCCVGARTTGTEDFHGSSALLCTDNGFAGFPMGRCENASAVGVTCGVGCSCGISGGTAACDCSRGLPVTKDGQVECAVFNCGSVTCGVGCTCSDPKLGLCTCP